MPDLDEGAGQREVQFHEAGTVEGNEMASEDLREAHQRPVDQKENDRADGDAEPGAEVSLNSERMPAVQPLVPETPDDGKGLPRSARLPKQHPWQSRPTQEQQKHKLSDTEYATVLWLTRPLEERKTGKEIAKLVGMSPEWVARFKTSEKGAKAIYFASLAVHLSETPVMLDALMESGKGGNVRATVAWFERVERLVATHVSEDQPPAFSAKIQELHLHADKALRQKRD